MHKLSRHSTLPQGKDAILEINNLSFRYPCHSIVLRGIDLSIYQNDRLAIVGANGSGKSTLARHLNGTFTDENNPVIYKGKPLLNEYCNNVRPQIGILFQDPDDHLFCNTVYEDVAFGPMNQGLEKEVVQKRVEESLKAVGLIDAMNKAPHHLSYGQKKRAALAAILAMSPEILILDEPTANLDPKQVEIISTILQNFQGTLVCISHDLFFLEEICQRAVVLQKGRIHHDYRMKDLMAAPEALREHGLDFSFKMAMVQPINEQESTKISSTKIPKKNHDIIKLSNFSFTYKDGTQVLKDINFTIKKGERVALTGENGAGKSTLAACLTGILSGKGRYLFEDRLIDQNNIDELWRHIGIIFQDSADQLFCPSCYEEVAFGLRQQNIDKKEIEQRVEEAIATVNLNGYEERSPLDMSGGERKRLAIASVICMRPKVLIMDEPTAGLDLQGEEMFLNAIKNLNMTHILISHNPFLIKKHCQRVVVIEEGQIVN